MFIIAGVFQGAFSGFQRFEIVNLARLGSMLFKALIWFAIVNREDGLITMAAVSVLSNALVICFYTYLLRKTYTDTRFKISLIQTTRIRAVFDYSKYVFVAMVANQLLNYRSAFVIGYYINAAAITYYSIPLLLTEYIKRFCLAVTHSYVPAFSELDSSGNYDSVFTYYMSGTRLIMVLSNLFCLGMIVFGEAFIKLWMGENYAVAAEPLLLILFVGFYFYAPHLVGYALLQGISKHQSYALWNIAISLAGLLLSIFLVQIYGLVGVAIGLAIPQVVYFGLIMPIYVCKLLRRSIIQYYSATHVKLIPPSIVLLAGLLGFKYLLYPLSYWLIVLEASISAVLYLITVYFIALTPGEKKITSAFAARFINLKRRTRESWDYT